MRILIFLIFLIPHISTAQVEVTFDISALSQISNDSIIIAKSTLIKAGNIITSQRDTINKQSEIITELDMQTKLQSIMLEKTDQETELMSLRIEISDGIITRYKVHLENDQKWFNKPWVYVTAGFVGALTTSVIINNISK